VLKILIVEADAAFESPWRQMFEAQRFRVETVNGVQQASALINTERFDVVILDMTLPEFDAVEFCRQYRLQGGVSAILLTARKHSSQQLEEGLEAGADDYMAKPIRLRELSARVRALLRRPLALTPLRLQVQNVELDSTAGIVSVTGNRLHLQPMEFNLLEFFMRHPNQMFTADALLERVWQDRNTPSVGSVRTHVKTLRHKLQDAGSASLIVTVRGRGYKLIQDGESLSEASSAAG
jgi:DNA-binding response OmpR family regulator